MLKTIISNKLFTVFVIVSGLVLFLILVISYNFQKSTFNNKMTNNMISLDVKENNNVSKPSETVEKFMKLISKDNLQKANALITNKGAEENERQKELQEIAPNINWAEVLKKRDLYFNKLLGEQIIEKQAIVNVSLKVKGVKNITILSNFYLRKINSEWKIYDIYLTPKIEDFGSDTLATDVQL